MLEKNPAIKPANGAAARYVELRLAELASLLGGCSVRQAFEAVRTTSSADALTRVAAALCTTSLRQPALTSAAGSVTR